MEKRGNIVGFATYRPPVPLDIFSRPVSPTSSNSNEADVEIPMTDGVSYNYNARLIPPQALKTILKRPKLASLGVTPSDVDSGRVSAMVFVSERGHLETLHIALQFNNDTKSIKPTNVRVFSLSDVFGTFDGVRMEDSGCIAGDYLVYVSTLQPGKRRQPWTAVYSTNLNTGNTERLLGEIDLSPSVSPSGKQIAVASFQGKANGWQGEIEDLKTNIFVMNVTKPYNRVLVVQNGGWPTWGSDDILFFHRKVDKHWGVFRADITKRTLTENTPRVTPDDIDAMTPAAINDCTVAVATVRQKSGFNDVRVKEQYRHIEIFDSTQMLSIMKLTVDSNPLADHFNPFVIDGGKRIGYHRCKDIDIHVKNGGNHLERQFQKLESPKPDVGVLRVSGAFPSFSRDGSKLAFVDNEFKSVLVYDNIQGLRTVFETKGRDNVFLPVWNHKKDILYVCVGPSFHAAETLKICEIMNVSGGGHHRRELIVEHNNCFPSTSPDGKRMVFRSTRDHVGSEEGYKNLYIMEDIQSGLKSKHKIKRLTYGDCTDTHCQWSPRENDNLVVFASSRDKPKDAPKKDNELDPGYFSVFLVKADDPSVVIRVLGSGTDLAGHVNHPIFSPDGMSLVVTADLAAVSVEPISLPLFLHSVRPYGDVFVVDLIDPDDIKKNEKIEEFTRFTHSRYENSASSWTMFSITQNSPGKLELKGPHIMPCPARHANGGETWHMTGHLCLPRRCC